MTEINSEDVATFAKWLHENIFPSKKDVRAFLSTELFAEKAKIELPNSFVILDGTIEMRESLLFLSRCGYKVKKTFTKNPKYLRVKGENIIFRRDNPVSSICKITSFQEISIYLAKRQDEKQ